MGHWLEGAHPGFGNMKYSVLTNYIAFCVYGLMAAYSSFVLIYLSPDYIYYRDYYDIVAQIKYSDQRFEPLYYSSVYLFSQMVSFESFVFMSTIFAAAIKVYCAFQLNKENTLYFAVAYLLVSFIILDVISLRANIAISLFMLSFVFFSVKRNTSLFALSALSAIGFHYSVIYLYILFVIFYKIETLNLQKIIYYSVIVYFGSRVLVEVAVALSLNPLLEFYIKEANLSGSILSAYSIFLFLTILILSFLYNAASVHSKALFVMAALIYTFATSLIFIPVLYFRYLDFTILLLLYFIISIKRSKSNRIAYWCGIFIFSGFCLFKITSLLIYSPVLLPVTS